MLPVLIAVWANVDRWSCWGRSQSASSRPRNAAREAPGARALGWTFVMAMVASVLSPNLFHAWELGNLVAANDSSDPAASPFWGAWYRTGPPAVGVAYAVLALLGLAALVRDRGSQARLWTPLWLFLLCLAAWLPPAAPFFAVVAGPIAALGLSGLWAFRLAPSPEDGKSRGTARLVMLGRHLLVPLVAAGLLVAAWPGWITGPPYGHPAWSVEVDESLRTATEDLARWRSEGVLEPDGRGLTLSREVADYWTWFGPDPREGVAGRAETSDLAAVRDALLGTAEGDRRPRPTGARSYGHTG